MAELTLDRPDPDPKPPPRPSHILAVCLEIGMVATFVAHHSVVGLVLCVAYAWFSATWALFL